MSYRGLAAVHSECRQSGKVYARRYDFANERDLIRVQFKNDGEALSVQIYVDRVGEPSPNALHGTHLHLAVLTQLIFGEDSTVHQEHVDAYMTRDNVEVHSEEFAKIIEYITCSLLPLKYTSSKWQIVSLEALYRTIDHWKECGERL